MKIMKSAMVFAALLAGTAGGPASAAPNDFPNHQIHFIVPYTPGTGMDTIARLVGEELSTKWGQTVVVENKLGAAGHLGAQVAAQQPADGYTVLVTASNLSITATLYKSDRFDPMKDLEPLLIAATGDSTLVVSNKSKFTKLSEILDYAKANPGKLTFASPGTGSPMHISLALLQQASGTQFLHIPYKGTAPAITDVISGQVGMTFVATHTVMPYVKAGQLRAIAVANTKRNPVAPDLPSFAEEGLPDFSTQAWYGFMLPTGVPPAVKAKLFDGITAALNKPEIKAALTKTGLNVRPTTTDEMREVVKDEYQRYGDIIRKYNIIGE
jgi:tripartite-type tricarboxylate transporter receptor subunit TctC